MKLLQKIRAAKDLSMIHLTSLINDYERVGEEQFMALADREVAPRQPRTRAQTPSGDPVLLELKKLQKQTMKAEPFVKAILAKATLKSIQFTVKAKPTSLPKLIEYFQLSSSDQHLLPIAKEVFFENSRSHTNMRAEQN